MVSHIDKTGLDLDRAHLQEKKTLNILLFKLLGIRKFCRDIKKPKILFKKYLFSENGINRNEQPRNTLFTYPSETILLICWKWNVIR